GERAQIERRGGVLVAQLRGSSEPRPHLARGGRRTAHAPDGHVGGTIERTLRRRDLLLAACHAQRREDNETAEHHCSIMGLGIPILNSTVFSFGAPGSSWITARSLSAKLATMPSIPRSGSRATLGKICTPLGPRPTLIASTTPALSGSTTKIWPAAKQVT